MRLVIDTNIFVHAMNPGEVHHDSSNRLLERILEGDEHLCVDPGVEFPPDRSRSKIWSEYRDNGLLDIEEDAVLVLVALFQADRVDEVAPATITFRSLRQCLYDNTDHIFYKVACATDERKLVSHDGVFHPTNAEAKKALRTLHRSSRVDVLTAAEMLSALPAA